MEGIMMVPETMPTVLCCLCGVSMTPNAANTCASCLQNENDITKAIPSETILFRCRGCGKFLKDGTAWTTPMIGLESKELLALCLKKLKGLEARKSGTALFDAKFLFSEPHSKRLRIELTVEKEVSGVKLRQVCVALFIIRNKMCAACHKVNAKKTWVAVTQVRQRANHKKTFLYLEQLILKHGQHKKAVKIEEARPYGMDFFFGHQNDAQGFLSFIESVVPVKKKYAKKVVTADLKSNVVDYQHTFLAEIATVCKDDLALLPKSIARRLGNISQFAICTGVNSAIRLVDPLTCQTEELSSEAYWKTPFDPILTAKRLIEFVVLDLKSIDYMSHLNNKGRVSENLSRGKHDRKKNKRKKVEYKEEVMFEKFNQTNKYKLVELEVARAVDFGVNDTRFIVKSHLGNYLKVGDSVLGYDLVSTSLNIDESDSNFSNIKEDKIPEILLVKKHYPLFRRKTKKHRRNWQLRKLREAKVEGDEDEELFMQDLEEDEEMRNKINVFRAGDDTAGNAMQTGNDDDSVEDDAPVIKMETMLDELTLKQHEEADQVISDEDDE